ncbi:MAG TPA: 4Fe-4S dicluster domain-containing protein [Actinomycetota bacterium]
MIPLTVRRLLDREGVDALIRVLRERGYTVVGPRLREQAIVYDEIGSVEDLPEGWTDEQEGGTYRLHRRDDAALFGYAVGPHSWKRELFPPETLLARIRRQNGEVEFEQPEPDAPRYAFLGVRACEVAAIEIQDRVFMAEGAEDPTYAARRRDALVIAVQCGSPSGTCFCVSMDTGPRVEDGYDLALTEILEGGHRFLLEVGSERGAEIADALPSSPAADEDVGAADAVVERAAASMGRRMETDGIKELLYRNLEHPRWEDVAQRCLACTNCTMVCPTCFCSTIEDSTDLSGETAERHRRWDSCFTLDHSEMGGGHVRTSTIGRYRQWMTHKLATWIDQFGTSGCVGCGRCITWCPVGIDITEEVAAIRASEEASG